jgi:hypothetical protein
MLLDERGASAMSDRELMEKWQWKKGCGGVEMGKKSRKTEKA